MSSKESLIVHDKNAVKEEDCLEEQENENVAYHEDSCESNNINSPVNVSGNKSHAEQATGLESLEVSRGGISVIARTAEAEAYLFPGATQSTDNSLGLATEVQSTSAIHLVVEHKLEQVEPLYSDDTVATENDDQESAVESGEGNSGSVVAENNEHVVTSEDGFQTSDISMSEVYAQEEEAVICDAEEEEAVICDAEEEEAVVCDAEEEEAVICNAEEEEAVICDAGEEEAVICNAEEEEAVICDAEEEFAVISGAEEETVIRNVEDNEEEVTIGETEEEEEVMTCEAEEEDTVTGDAEEEVIADNTGDGSIGIENEESVEVEMKSEETEDISHVEVGGVLRQEAESIEGLEDYQAEYQDGSITQDHNVEEHQTEEVETENPHEEIEEEVAVHHQPENQLCIHEVINPSSAVETECQPESGVVEACEDDSNVVKDNDGDFAGEGEMEDDGEGEEFGGEEEEFEDSEEMGDEVEVEIEDCSDSEMEPEGGVTYIISEGMIVVEENEGSETFQPADIADVSEEEHIVCEDQLGKTTTIVIKVPSLSSKSTNETESSVNPDHSPVSEAAGITIAKSSENCSSPSSTSNVSMTHLKPKSDSFSIEKSSQKNVSQNLSDGSVQKSPEVESFKSAVSDSDTSEKSDVQVEHSVSAQGIIVSEMVTESESNENAETTINRKAQVSSDDSSSVCDKPEAQQVKVAAATEVNLPVLPIKKSSSKGSEASATFKEGDISGTLNGRNVEPTGAVLSDAKEQGAVSQAIKLGRTPKTSEEPGKLDKSMKESKQTTASSNAKPSEKPTTKSLTKTETKGPKTVSQSKNHSTQEKNHSESSKEKRSVNSSDGSRHSSKHTHNSAHKHKSQSTKLSADEKSLNVTKSSSKHEAGLKEDRAKTESVKKQTETMDPSSRTSHNDGHQSSKGSSSHRTRSNSTSSKESSGKDKRSSRKDESSSKVSNITSGTSDTSGTSKPHSESKIALRSSRSRKSQPEPLSATRSAEDVVQSKKDKSKTIETPIKPRHSERVSKATEKAIASGLLSRRSKPANTDYREKSQDPSSEDNASQRRSKRKAESSPITKEEVPLNKRRTTRSGEAQPIEEAAGTSSQSLRSVRKSKSMKRRGSSPDLPPAKQVHHEDISPKDKVTEEFVANIPKMCRICGSNNDNLLNVFGPEGRTMQLAEKVHSILPIKMREDEPLPSGVCHSCVVTLIACEKLVEKCSSIEKRLRAHFKCPTEKLTKDTEACLEEESSSIPLPIPEKSIQSGSQPPQSSNKPAETPTHGHDETSTSNIKSAPSTRSSARVSAKNKLAESASKTVDTKSKSASKSSSVQEETAATKKQSAAPIPESEDSPPVLEAEPPQSHVSASNQEPSAQPPVLVPQPGKPVPELVPIPTDEASNASKQRFGNTYRARMKPGQWEKIERGLEAIHGELQQDEQEEGLSDVKPFSGNITEEFHIVDLDMNVEEVPQGVPVEKSASSLSSEFHVEIPEEMPDEDTAVQQSSPKSVIDSILVDWSGDEDEVVLPLKANAASSGRKIVSGGKDNVNGSALNKEASSSPKIPCLFGDDEEGDGTPRAKLKAALPTAAPTSVIVKQESFWPEPAPGTSTTSSEKPPSDVPWKCFVCGKRGKSLSKFLEHKKLHLNDRKLVSCPKCSESFSNMGLLKAHMKAHHGDDDEDDVVEIQPRQTRRKTATQEKVVDVDLAPATDGLYHCSLCLSAFTTIESLCQHKLTHTKADSSDMHKCTVCRKTFSQHKELQQHMATHHQSASQNLALFQCAKCDMKMSNQKEFIEHIESHSSGQQNFTCDLCNKVFDTKHKLRSHRSTVHKSTAYACHLCDKVCQKRITLIEHLRKHTGDNPFACPVCNKRFNRLANYKAHMTIHENARRYECPYCGKRFNRQSIQQRHIKTHTSEQSRKHRCRVCNLTFGLATEMFTHRKLHTREEVERATWEDEKQRLALTSFPCKVCQISFNAVEDVLAHMPVHTDDERDIAAKLKNPRLECDICGKVLNSKRTFNAHRSSHIDGKPFVCKICSKGYSTSTGLNYHMLSHTGERPFPCTFCQKGYKNSTDLKVHMRQHTGEFPYKCNLCNKAFRSASSLQKHGFVHTNHRPFKCQFCNMSFKRENTKLNHERIHTNDRRFKCKVCARTFIQKGACDAHEKLHFRSGTLSYIPGESPVGQSFDENSASTSGKADKHDLFEDFEEEDFDEDDDDEDEYIIYEDEDGIDEVEDEEDITGDIQNDMKNLTKGVFEEASKSSNGVDLPVTTITPVPVSMTNDVVPSVSDNSVHITIL